MTSCPSKRGFLASGFAPLTFRNYRLYWYGQAVSLVGTWMQLVSLPWLVLALGGSPVQLALVAALQFGPPFLLAPFSGVLADRVDKRQTLIVAHLAGAAQITVFFAVTATGNVTIASVMVMALWLGFVNSIEMPIRQSFVAELVPRRMVPNAIALNSMAFNSARVVGPALAGAGIAAGAATLGSTTAGVAVILGLNVLTSSAVLIALLRMNGPTRGERGGLVGHPSVLTSLLEGMTYASRAPIVLWPLVLLGGIAAFGLNFQILLPLFAREVLALDAVGYGALYATLGVASVAGSLTLAYMRRRHSLPLMVGGGALFAFALVGLGVARTSWLAFVAVAATGYFSMIVINTVNATIQANVPDLLRGRVMSLYVTVFAGSAPLGSLFAGWIVEVWDTPVAVQACGVSALATVVLAGWRLRAASSRGRLGVILLDTTSMTASSAATARPR